MTDETKIGRLGELDGGGGQSHEILTAIADQTLSYFEDSAATAETALATDKTPSLDVLASINTLTGLAAQTLTGISEETRRNLEAVVARPAIARVEVLNEANEREVIFITPAGAPRGRWGNVRIASYRSPVGRLAAVPVGSEIEVATKASLKSYELVGRAKLNPQRPGGVWDSRDTVVEQLSGQVRGHDNDVRVFDVQHIKGLEFEAVFFVGVDELAQIKPTLFDKFLYVGATRAAMYLGLTTASEDVPEELRPIESLFKEDWRSGR